MTPNKPHSGSIRLIGALFAFVAVLGLGGCADEVSPLPESEFHEDGWLNPSAPEFHGAVVLASADKAEICAGCHGGDYQGGPNDNGSCFTCHEIYPHDAVFSASTQQGNHAAYLREVANWDIGVCQSCHGGDFAGNGTAEKTCLTCHSEPEGPAACNTCHGATPEGNPPPDLLGHSDSSLLSVGAHESHIAASVACESCHVTPASFDAEGHLGEEWPARAEIVFGGLSTQSGVLTPIYDPNSGTCGSTYCHGGFVFQKSESDNQGVYSGDVISGNNAEVQWNAPPGTQAECGSCHGLPPTGHQNFENFGIPCSACHASVVNADNEIVAPELHGNGQIDL